MTISDVLKRRFEQLSGHPARTVCSVCGCPDPMFIAEHIAGPDDGSQGSLTGCMFAYHCAECLPRDAHRVVAANMEKIYAQIEHEGAQHVLYSDEYRFTQGMPMGGK